MITKNRKTQREIHRLKVGPLELVSPGRDKHKQQLWAIPGGAIVSYDDVARYAECAGWGPPIKIYAGMRGRQ
jgi:hypothetical protein